MFSYEPRDSAELGLGVAQVDKHVRVYIHMWTRQLLKGFEGESPTDLNPEWDLRYMLKIILVPTG